MFDRHPPEEFFEEYVFGRLGEIDCARFEEHLLLCEQCQRELEATDQYVALMKQASAAGPTPSRTPLRAWRMPVLIGAAAVLVLAAIAIPYQLGGEHPTVAVQLVAWRGGSDAMAHARAGTGLDITMDCPDVSSAGAMRLEIVNAAGERVWTGTAVFKNGSTVASARVLPGFRRGTYWVRLYSPGGELLREFGLRTD